MSRIDASLACLLLALVSPGCTLITNGNQYVGSGVDTGMPTDAGPQPDTNSDGSATDTGPHVNTPPVVTTLGLDNYRPTLSETLRALPGRVYDRDGDATSIHFQWTVNGTAVSGATTATLAASTLAEGDQVHVEAWANDGMEDGPHVFTFDVRVLGDGPQWRQLLPSNASDDNMMVWDAAHHRELRFIDGGLWEYAIDGSDVRVSLLPTSGTPPPLTDNAIAMLDEERRQLIVYSTADASSIYTVDITNRGPGIWMQVPTTGTPPTNPFFATELYDLSTRSIYIIGGFDDTDGALAGLTRLDLSTTGAARWVSVTPTGDMLPRMMAGAAAGDPTMPGRFYLFGGATSTVGTPTVNPVFSMLDHVLQLDVSATGVRVTMRAATAPGFWGGAAAINPVTGHAILYGGADEFGPSAAPVPPQVYDPATEVFTPLGGTAPHGAFLGSLVPDPYAPGHLDAFTRGAGFVDGSSGLQYDDVTETGVTEVATIGGPGRIVDAAARLYGQAVEVVGGTDGSNAVTTSWSLDLMTLAWSVFAPGDDPATGTHPVQRFGVISDASPYSSSRLFQVGGARADGVLADMVVFELDNSDRTWLQRTVGAGLVPEARVGAIVAPEQCGGSRLFVYGGQDALGTVLPGDVFDLECTSDHSCSWTMGFIDSGRSYAASFTNVDTTYVFGGRTTAGPTSDLVAIYTCAGMPAVAPLSVTGPGPSARYGHTFTTYPTVDGTNSTAYVFGGTDGTAYLADITALTVTDAGTGEWSSVAITGTEMPAPRANHVMVADTMRERLLLIGGDVRTSTGGGGYGDDVWELRLPR
jgi:hypothetical protein